MKVYILGGIFGLLLLFAGLVALILAVMAVMSHSPLSSDFGFIGLALTIVGLTITIISDLGIPGGK